ncbi:histidine phosphatase family protein [Actinoplanes sp. TBRC 11911]|uniref:SixA phosphatase family protein n=1 Tax=Actinoplanes sp. TBRC 11911 TaxID=2729386 RepID=UPI00145D0572|nr:histidine phosphatase family protein [Actinoplanes sp. TBRC 11911]NMO57605.1 histidine phosphatase family protein [Actinoplanes sp. TBRC 11911]
MRTLVLLRHAKAEHPESGSDFDRRLTTRGTEDAVAAGTWLNATQIHPDLVFCSPAVRTRETWAGVGQALGSPEVRFEQSLYDGGRTEVFDLLRAVPAEVQTVLLIGHNPTVSEVSLLLIPDSEWDGQQIALKTSGLAIHSTDAPWSETEPGSMHLTSRHTARA